MKVTLVPFGSSPRMWGTPEEVVDPAGYIRFIPTHVGNTPRPAPAAQNNKVHPHACGEHDLDYSGDFDSSGSSPRMWGTLFIKKLIKIICYVFKPKLRG